MKNKKIFKGISLILIIIFCFTLSSCNNSSEKDVSTSTTSTIENVDYKAINLQVNYENKNDEKIVYPYIIAIYNNQELENFYDENKENWDLSNNAKNVDKNFRKLIDEKYTEEFFNSNFLLVSMFKETDSETFHKIKSIEKSGEETTINVQKFLPTQRDGNESFWIIPIEVDLKYKGTGYYLKIEDFDELKK
ncbi:MAG: hypothetical protein RR483_01790 [Clostridia bacterium]